VLHFLTTYPRLYNLAGWLGVSGFLVYFLRGSVGAYAVRAHGCSSLSVEYFAVWMALWDLGLTPQCRRVKLRSFLAPSFTRLQRLEEAKNPERYRLALNVCPC